MPIDEDMNQGHLYHHCDVCGDRKLEKRWAKMKEDEKDTTSFS